MVPENSHSQETEITSFQLADPVMRNVYRSKLSTKHSFFFTERLNVNKTRMGTRINPHPYMHMRKLLTHVNWGVGKT